MRQNPAADQEPAADAGAPPAESSAGAAEGDRRPSGDAAATPVMAQYLAIKAEHPDSLLFFRMGDFYELFFDDAVAAAGALDIALTRRGTHQGQDVPMCGVPVHSHEGYLARLIRRGYRVAVCEQLEDPSEARKRGGKAVVRRDVVRIVTAGTLTEDGLLDARHNNFLAALAEAGGDRGLAWIDMSTGDFCTQVIADRELAAALARIEPGELLVSEPLAARADVASALADWRDRVTLLPASRFDSVIGEKRLAAALDVAAIDAFGAFERCERAAAGALVDYLLLTQKGRMPRLLPPARLAAGAVMEIDQATRRNLELTRSLSGERRNSLLQAIDLTVTAGGARLLAARLAAPLTDPEAIGRRLDEVQVFVDGESLREAVVDLLSSCPDLERALSRLCLDRGGPRDLAAVRDGLALATRLGSLFSAAPLIGRPAGLDDLLADLGGHDLLIAELSAALAADLPVAARDGGAIAAGYAADLDAQRAMRDDGRQLIAALQARYGRETAVASLKIRHNAILGYFVEVPVRQAERLDPATFFHRQTMANAVRFSTAELHDLERAIASAADRALAIELAILARLTAQVTEAAGRIARAAAALSAIDVAAALARVASERSWCRPVLDDSLVFEVTAGRHPVVEAALRADGAQSFVPNDCRLAEGERLWLLTGPNMAGKSTFLRQNALLVVLAQIGAFVPAARARIGIVDRLFSRVGAADDLARGRSTFMVEMVETATILNQAGPRSLVILDEIGRGTATYDGLSIAWAVVEHLHNVNRCRGLFATHYHELTALAGRLKHLACRCLRVKEWKGTVVFLHEVVAGAADRSYGLHVARLAGLPKPVLARAEAVLRRLERGEMAGAAVRLADDLPLFAGIDPPAAIPDPSPLEAAVRAIEPDTLTPKQALDLLYSLKALARDGAA